MTREEFYKLTDILDSEVLDNFMHGGEASEVIAQFEEAVEKSCILKEEPVSNPTPNEKMSVERWKKACEAACCDSNYRSHYGLTETRDDYFVDGVQWADEHPKEEPVSEDLEAYADECAASIKQRMTIAGVEDDNSIEEYIKQACINGAHWHRQQMERNRIAHCKSITNEQAEVEGGFVSSHIEANHRMPTFLDAIEYGMELKKKEMLKDAIPAEASWYDGWHITFHDEDVHDAMPAGVNDGDKVKLIIVRED